MSKKTAYLKTCTDIMESVKSSQSRVKSACDALNESADLSNERIKKAFQKDFDDRLTKVRICMMLVNKLHRHL